MSDTLSGDAVEFVVERFSPALVSNDLSVLELEGRFSLSSVGFGTCSVEDLVVSAGGG